MGCSYYEVYNLMRNVTGVGEGDGAYLSIHDGFIGQGSWVGLFTGMDRIAIETHPYEAFGGEGAWNPAPSAPCQGWGLPMDQRCFVSLYS